MLPQQSLQKSPQNQSLSPYRTMRLHQVLIRLLLYICPQGDIRLLFSRFQAYSSAQFNLQYCLW